MKLSWKLFKCMFGKHEQGDWKIVVGGRTIRTCNICDKIVAETRMSKRATLNRSDAK